MRKKSCRLNHFRDFRYLNNQSSYVVIERIDADGKLSYSDASLSGEIGSYKVIMDYCIYTILPVKNDEVVIGYKKIGVGIRVTAAITTTKANVNLGSLLAIGLGAKTGSLNGALLVDVIGITSNDVTNLVPLTADIDQTSIQTVLQAVAAIKSKIHDEKTTLYPQIIAVKQLEKGNIESINKDEYNRGIKEGSILMGKMRKILSYTGNFRFCHY